MSDDFPPPFHTTKLDATEISPKKHQVESQTAAWQIKKHKRLVTVSRHAGYNGFNFFSFFLYAIKSKIKPSGFVTKPIYILIYIQKLYFHVFTCTYIEYYGNFIVPYFHIYFEQHNVTNYIFTMLQIFNSQIWQDKTFST